MQKICLLFLLALTLNACIEQNPNETLEGADLFEEKAYYLNQINPSFRDTVYVPVYSDIYSGSRNMKYDLTATLSIRNTSLTDSIFLEKIDYYNNDGLLVRSYVEGVLLLKPMQSVQYVIEKDDQEGGTGANFIVCWGANQDQLHPVMQGVMISTEGQQGISFLTEGVSISKKHR